ncbi:hypothetical protein SapgrDRAFT_1637 [Saprospira grandis DSM 2844]|uniref:Uncharacterized protein n=1 Tax=Saprospira grandis DSM 2844 TaxID=694433 RepID=J0P0N1_9BACT|nr:hypothetical protein SapgrDRAFT_1637 [Saprospira grandis DSM 2844]
MIWGCPALRAGRAVSQLAIRSALRKISLRSFCWVCGFAALLPIPQPAALRACRT